MATATAKTPARARREGSGEIIERIPNSILLEILAKLDLESLCSVAPVCRALRSLVSQTLSSIRTLDLSGFAPTVSILSRILGDNQVLQSLTLDCTRLDDSALEIFAKEHLRELVLLKCFLFSSYVYVAIGEKCQRLRLLSLEMICQYEFESPHTCRKAIAQMLHRCLCLEFLCLKFQTQNFIPGNFEAWQFFEYETFKFVQLSTSMKALILQPLSEKQAKMLCTFQYWNMLNSPLDFGTPSPCPLVLKLQSLTLVLDKITDELLGCITMNLVHLVELCLEDRPSEDPSIDNDLTSLGLQSLTFCKELTCLSLTRTKQNFPATFKRINDVDMLLLAEGCRKLESIRLGGFSRVTDAGYVSILQSCRNLKKIEFVNGAFLSDLAFHNLADVSCSLTDVRLVSCSLLTSDTAEYLSMCRSLEVLDLSGCKSIADSGLYPISRLCKLTKLDIGGADVTDSGVAALGNGTSPIASLCLRGCKRITDKGIAMLLKGNGVISKTLSTLDMGYMPCITDKAVNAVAELCAAINDLSIRYCFSVTDSSIAALGSIQGLGSEKRSLRRLDVYNCCGLSSNSVRLFAPPYFRGLRWLGAGGTKLSFKAKERYMDLNREKPMLTICVNGCQLGCKDGWQFHEQF